MSVQARYSSQPTCDTGDVKRKIDSAQGDHLVEHEPDVKRQAIRSEYQDQHEFSLRQGYGDACRKDQQAHAEKFADCVRDDFSFPEPTSYAQTNQQSYVDSYGAAGKINIQDNQAKNAGTLQSGMTTTQSGTYRVAYNSGNVHQAPQGINASFYGTPAYGQGSGNNWQGSSNNNAGYLANSNSGLGNATYAGGHAYGAYTAGNNTPNNANSSSPYAGNSSAYVTGASKDVGDADQAPVETRKCNCGIDVTAKVSNSAANSGRLFFACPKPRDDPGRCKFFEWQDGLSATGSKVPTGGFQAGADGAYGDRSFYTAQAAAQSGDGGAKSGTCFKCGQPGHWSRDCPQKAAGGFGGNPGGGAYGGGNAGGGFKSNAGAGGGGGSGTCFTCGETGHWSKDCPKKAAGAGGGGAYKSYDGGSAAHGNSGGFGASAGGGNWGGNTASRAPGGGVCYRCKQPGHFSNACPNR